MNVNGYEIGPYANLTGANLTGANLTGANLARANLAGANLTGANLTGADLTGAYLAGANLARANLAGADLTGAYLAGAYLAGAYLAGAYLTGAYLTGAYLAGAYLAGASGLHPLGHAQLSILPDGVLTGWKICQDRVLVKLRIPAKAKRSNATGRKCRAEYAKVIEIIGANEAVSRHDPSFVYKVGATVRPKEPFDDDWTIECGSGIHFYITREEAEAG